MRFLIDENLALSFARILREKGLDTSHVIEEGLGSFSDEDIVSWAIQKEYVIITFDLDFSRIVALSAKNQPSVITFRLSEITIPEIVKIIVDNIEYLGSALSEGVLVTIDHRGIRIQKLPIRKKRD